MKKTKSGDRNKKLPPAESNHSSFPIVGIGASAGGLEAFQQLLAKLSDKPGMALVFIIHLAPEHKSILTEILTKSTKMPVNEIKNGMNVLVNHVYIIPPSANVSIENGKLILSKRNAADPKHMPIDIFFKSLAKDRGSKSIGVILSGTATDGTLGSEAIKAEGGIVFAQDSKSAKYDGMPQSAISAGSVDFVLPPRKIAEEMERIIRHPLLSSPGNIGEKFSREDKGRGLEQIFDLLHSVKGLDFSHYKPTTINRRISRRMILHKLKNLSAYIKFLRSNSSEIENLYDDLLINVTSFFRDPKTFDSLKKQILPEILKNKTKDQVVRIWVPGCSSGEEAYSIAICLIEAMGNRIKTIPIQIFATDVREVSLKKARKGMYGKNIEDSVSGERLKLFFKKDGGSYCISKQLRDMCVFSMQNVFSDPPFSNIDLISCRNLLIYLQPALQKTVLQKFHYAIRPGGFLLLGNSESIGSLSNLFTPFDKKNKIFIKKYVLEAQRMVLEFPRYPAKKLKTGISSAPKQRGGVDAERIIEQIVLNEYASSSVLIDSDMEAVQFHGHTGMYLESPEGRPSHNIFKLARNELLVPLRTAIYQARHAKHIVKKEKIKLKYNGRIIHINIVVIPKDQFFLIIFSNFTGKAANNKLPKGHLRSNKNKNYIESLQQELLETKEYLQTIIEEQESANEEVKTANEEILSSNEELQSTNEELQTAKEELQSSNEELQTTNEELQNRNLEAAILNNDLTNLLSNINMPIVMFSRDLVIRRGTPQIEKVLNIIPSDIGRPISKIKLNIDIPGFEKLLLDVIESLRTKEFEIKDKDGNWYWVNLRPYRTQDNKIDGAVAIFSDITVQKRFEQSLAQLNKKTIDELKLSYDIKSKFTSVVSHELRTPLAAIIEGVNIVLDGTAGALNDEQKEFLTISKRNVDRLSRLINNILDFQKMEGGKEIFNMSENDINEVADEVCKTMKLLTNEKHLELITKFEPKLPKIVFDRDKITQVLTNLLSNAIKFTEKGGISITTARENGSVHITVKDSGPGIKSDDIQKLFQPFEQITCDGIRKPGSAGLGLVISKEIILAHNGKIWLESEGMQGTSVHITLPIMA